MNKVKCEFINNEEILLNHINKLDKIANNYIIQIEELYMEDLFFISIIDKSIKLINSFLYALNERNLTVLASLTRIQMDCTIRAFSTTLVADSGAFCKDVIVNDIKINNYKDKNNRKLTDEYLCEQLEKKLKLPIYDLYEKVCGFVHFSSKSFHNIVESNNNNSITMFISRKNQKNDEKEFERLSIELANQFLYFGLVLIEEIFASWLIYKKTLPNNSSNL